MAQIKALLDPKGILNPYKTLPDDQKRWPRCVQVGAGLVKSIIQDNPAHSNMSQP